MFKKFFKKKNNIEINTNSILIAALLVHAAKIDENYTDLERKIIKRALITLNNISEHEAQEILSKAEKKEQESNQIIEFTREIKKKSMDYRIKIVEILWKIIYSDGTSDNYESNLIRRICGLLYISDRDSGMIKQKIQSLES
tara:strand:- start:259 stop:684 length:426 start_codon:yes stop_codon:yes gene_type:complete